MEKITITGENEEKIELYVLEQTKMNGFNYLLVTESEDEEAEAYILKDTASDENTEAMYEFVDDEDELNALATVFSELMEDTDII